MIAYIQGELTHVAPEYVIVDVMGLGYRVLVPGSTLQAMPAPGSKVKLFTHLYVREDGFSLYGFVSPEEYELFVLLLSVSGVGPRMALSILSAVTPGQFREAVSLNEAGMLTRIPGIGPKTAQRIILELKDKIGSLAPVAETLPKTVPGTTAEALQALTALGYSLPEASRAVTAALKDLPPGTPVAVVVRQALKTIGQQEGTR